MPAGELRQLLREEIEQFLPQDALKVAKVAEEEEKRTLLDLAEIAQP